MTRLDKLRHEADSAEADIRSVLKDGPVTTGDLLQKLNHDWTNFLLTQWIGDGNGQWDGCVHQLALADMIDKGIVTWWRDSSKNVWYGLKDTAQ